MRSSPSMLSQRFYVWLDTKILNRSVLSPAHSRSRFRPTERYQVVPAGITAPTVPSSGNKYIVIENWAFWSSPRVYQPFRNAAQSRIIDSLSVMIKSPKDS